MASKEMPELLAQKSGESSSSAARDRTTDDSTSAGALRITEIFYSLQGEARSSGLATVFVRLTGCPLRCTYCDSAYAFYGGEKQSIAQVLARVASFSAQYVCVTGGEPLAQKRCQDLLRKLCDAGYQVSLETSGAMNISGIDARVCRVMDIKTPDSGELAKNRWENIALLTSHDQVKFVLCSRADFDWACKIIQQYQLSALCEVLFSASFHQLRAVDLADWILAERAPVRFQLQAHKYLWGDIPGK
jgi:7-carboxy-7-deazaguanine synthase